VGLRTVALFEAAKGALVLLAGFGVFALIHRDAQHAADQLVRHFHLNPAHRFPRIFLHLAGQATPAHLWLLAAGGLCYALLRFIEAYGLWHGRPWAEWLAVISSGIYLLVVRPDLRVERRPATTGARVGNETIIWSGIKNGEKLVTSGLERVTPGKPIKIHTDSSQTLVRKP
jgi:uncharacterized membrane protein (DUF2068 family)